MDDIPDQPATDRRSPDRIVLTGRDDSIKLTEQQLRARRGRSIAIALALGAFVVLIFLVTIVRLGSGVLTQPL